MLQNESDLTLLTPPAVLPVGLAEAKNHLRIDDDVDDDNILVTAIISAATDWAQVFTRRQFVNATYVLKMDYLPTRMVLPRPPLVSVTSIKWKNEAGTEQTVDSSLYDVISAAEPGMIVEGYNKTLPISRGHKHDVTITFVAGYGDASDVPPLAKLGILLMAGHLYENREAVQTGPGMAAVEIPLSLQSILIPLRWGDYS